MMNLTKVLACKHKHLKARVIEHVCGVKAAEMTKIICLVTCKSCGREWSVVEFNVPPIE